MPPPAELADFLSEVYLFYGLSCLLLAVAAHLLPRERAVARFAPDAWLLALFALVHGAKELTDWWLLAHHSHSPRVASAAGVMALLSFVPLLELGRRLVLSGGGPAGAPARLRPWLGPRIHALGAVGVVTLTAVATDPWIGLRAGARCFLAFPGGVLTALGLVLYIRESGELRAQPGLVATLGVAALGLLGFTVLEGLVVPADPGLSWLPTQEGFLARTGLPVQLFRALFVAATAVAFMEAGRGLVGAAHERSRRALQQANAVLEQRVAERTAGLEATRTRLELEIAERRERERALAASEARLRAMLDTEPECVKLLDREGRVLEMNRAGLAMLEIDAPEQLLNRPVDGWVVPAYREAFHALCALGFAGEASGLEFEMQSLRGTRRWMETRAAPLRDAAGGITALLAISRDVTERKRAEQALRVSEENLRRAQRVASIGSWHLDLGRDELSWSEQTYRIFGIPYGTPMSYPRFLAAVHPDDREATDRAWRAACAGGPYDIEHRIVVAGEVRWLREQAEMQIDAGGNVIGGVGTVHDITDRRAAEQAIREAEARYRTLVEQIPAITYVAALDEHSSTTYVSPQLESILGYAPRAWLEDPGLWAARLHPADRERVLAEVATSQAGGSPLQSEYRMLRCDGSVAWFRDGARAVHDDSGRPLFLQGVMVDITDLKLAEAALRESEAKYRLLFEANPHPMWVYDLQTLAFLAVNDAAVAHYGWSREEFLAMSIAGIRPPDEVPALLANVAQVREGLDRAGVWRHRLKDGRVIEVEITSHTLEIAGRRAELVLALDVTERRRTEREVREKERLFHLVANTSPALIWMSGTDGLCSYFNETWLLHTGRSLEQELGNGWAEGVHPDDLERCLETYRGAFAARRPFVMEFRLRRHDGEYRWILDDGRPRHAADGTFEGYIGSCLDIHDRKRTEAEVARARSLLRAVVDSTPDWIVAKDEHHRLIMLNRAFASAHGLAPEDMLGRPDTDFSPREPRAGDPEPGIRGAHADDARALAGHVVHNPAEAVTLADGTKRTFDTLKLPLRDASGQTFGVLAYARDVSERRRAEEALRDAVSELQVSARRQRDLLQIAQREQGRMAALLSAMSIGILFEDSASTIEYVNPAFRRIWAIPEGHDLVGCPTREAVETSGHQFARQDHASKYVLRVIDTHEISDRFEIDLADGRILTQISYPVEDPEGRLLGRLWIYEDVTHERQTAEQLIYLAERDPLTGLYNRHRFQEQLDHLIGSVHRSGGKFALLYFDLDEFKHVNDSFGHRAGDTVLVRVAGEIRNHVRATESFSRVGGDEFAVLSHAETPEDVAALAARILRAVSSIPFRFRGTNIRMTSSLGVAIYPDHGETAEDLVAHADAAMYHAKYQGKNTWALYDPARENSEAMVERLTWNRRIGEALERDLLQLHFQGVYRTGNGELSHLEALVRMGDPAAPERLIMPGQFIAFAEKSGQILDIDRWVIREAVEVLARSPQIPPIAINVSGRSFDDPALPGYIRARLAERGVDAHRLMVELTETAAVSDIQDAQRFIEGIRRAGCRVCLDDFGSGFSSFAYLKYLDADILKIDGLFIRDLPNNRDNQVFVKAMVDVARGLRKTTVAEFVEDSHTLRMVASLGVDLAQGYHLDRPCADHPALGVG